MDTWEVAGFDDSQVKRSHLVVKYPLWEFSTHCDCDDCDDLDDLDDFDDFDDDDDDDDSGNITKTHIDNNQSGNDDRLHAFPIVKLTSSGQQWGSGGWAARF